ncbi:hypothetical protein H6771_00645 [Candidatus Peribacteria bacterium]|nr:hypothetical protein [Candidatus Peribacteria bacterium]
MRFLSAVLAVIMGLFGLLLPWHGLLSVLLPESLSSLRLWKEALLALLGFIALGQYLAASIAQRRLQPLPWVTLLSLLLLLWGGVALLTTPIASPYAVQALRSLLLGPLVLGVITALPPRYRVPLSTFMTPLIISTVLGVVFGLWAWGDGFAVLSQWYSPTISSWVPGQTLPLYHEAWGLPRMQGGASGPVAFAHMLLIALWGLYYHPPRWPQWLRTLCGVVLLLGIGLSFTRAVWLVLALWGLWQWHVRRPLRRWQWGGILLLGALALSVLLPRAGTVHHVTAPMAVVQHFTQQATPGQYLTGRLGSIGPAARMQAMAEQGTDRAPIAENVWLDVLVQLGGVGLLLMIMLWWQTYRGLEEAAQGLLLGFVLLTNMATLFDMTPLSLSFFLALGLSYRPRTSRVAPV